MKKEFWKSKTFWASILIALGVVGNYLAGNMGTQELIMGIGAALGLFGIRDAVKK